MSGDGDNGNGVARRAPATSRGTSVAGAARTADTRMARATAMAGTTAV